MNTTRIKWGAPVAVASLVAILVIAFFPALFGGKLLAPLDITKTLLAPWNENANGAKPHNHSPSDAVTQYLPYRIHAENSLKEDGYIGWNPYTMGGSSLAANTMALPGSWTMQLHRFLPFRNAWNLGLFAEFLIAGGGMLVFLRSRGLGWAACLLGAAVYMMNSQFIIWVYHRWALSSFSWMPWVLWASDGGFSWKNPTRRQLMLPFFLALALLGSTLQHMVFVGLACGCIFMGSIGSLKASLQQGPAMAKWAVAFFLAVAMAAFTIAPQVLAYSTNVEIGHTRGGIGYPEGALQPVFNLIAIPAQIWPWLLGDPQTIDAWRLLKSNFMNLAYFGTIPMLLAISGLFIKSMPRGAKWLIAVGLLIPLTPLVGPLYHRVQLLFILGGAWMVAEMLGRSIPVIPRYLIRGTVIITAAAGVALLAGTLLPGKIRSEIENTVVSKSISATADSNFGGDSAWIQKRATEWTNRFSMVHPRTATIFGFLVLGTAGLVFCGKNKPRQQSIGTGFIIVASSLELLTLFQTWSTYSNPDDLRPSHPAVEIVRTLAGSDRVLQGFASTSLGETFAAPNLLSSYRIPSVDAYESIQYDSVRHTLGDLPAAEQLSLSGVGISVQPSGYPPLKGTERWPVTAEKSGYSIRRNPDVVPSLLAGSDPIPATKADVAPALRTSQSLTTSLKTMNRQTFDWPAGTQWVRMDQNWHPGWHWKSGSSDWKEFTRGPDGACWIVNDGHLSSTVEARFFPTASPVLLVSLLVSLVWMALVLIRPRVFQFHTTTHIGNSI